MNDKLVPKVYSGEDFSGAAPNFWWRLFVWRDGMKEFLAHPLLGIGFNRQFDSLSVYQHLVECRIGNYQKVDLHNSIFQPFLRGGLILGVPFLFMIITLLRLASPWVKPLYILLFILSLGMVTFEVPHILLPSLAFIFIVNFLTPNLEPLPE
jgi:O-antigen ligase